MFQRPRPFPQGLTTHACLHLRTNAAQDKVIQRRIVSAPLRVTRKVKQLHETGLTGHEHHSQLYLLLVISVKAFFF